MFRKWLSEHNIDTIDLSRPLFPPAGDRAYWEKFYRQEYIDIAEEYLHYDWPVMLASQFMAYKTEGNRVKQEDPHFARRKAVNALLIGEILEHKGRFLPDLVDGVYLICEETYWGLSAHRKFHDSIHPILNLVSARDEDQYIDLFAAETAVTVALTVYLLKDELTAFCPEILERIDYELHRRVLTPYLTHEDFWWMAYGRDRTNNWTPWILSNMLTVAVTMDIPRQKRIEAIRKILYEVQVFYDSCPSDGGCDEGSGYWAQAGASLCDLLDQLYRISGGAIDFFSDPKVRAMGAYEAKTYIGNRLFVNFCDGTNKIPVGHFGIIYIYGMRTDNPYLKSLAREHALVCFEPDPEVKGKTGRRYSLTQARRSILNVTLLDEVLAQPPFVGSPAELLPDLQQSFLRVGNWFVAAKGGNNDEGHNHNDVGSFLVYDGVDPVLVDPGCGTYTQKTFSPKRYEIWTMQSSWHNLPEINGTPQGGWSRDYAADAFALEGKTTRVSFAGAYERGANIESLRRTVDPREDGVFVTDVFAFAKEGNTVEEHFITPLSVKKDENRVVIGDRYILEADGEVFFDSVSFDGDSKLVNAWNTEGLNRIIIRYAFEQNGECRIVLRRK